MNIKMIHETKEGWIIEGNSEIFPNRITAMRRAKELNSQRSKKRKDNGRRFVSQRLKMNFRSNWEIELAELMADLGIHFEYEPKRFFYKAEQESYLPDFYLPEYNVWIEVKGFMDKRSLKRVKLFRKYQGKQYGFFLYEKEERDLIRANPELIYTFIEIAKNEVKRGSK